MKQPYVIAAAAIVIACIVSAFVAPAAAEVTVNEKQDYERYVYIPCTADWVHLNGTLHVVHSVTVDENGGYHVFAHYQPMNVVGEGLISGDTYRATGVTQWRYNFVSETDVYTRINRFNIIGTGNDTASYRVHQTTHYTIVDGEIKSWVSKREVTCG